MDPDEALLHVIVWTEIPARDHCRAYKFCRGEQTKDSPVFGDTRLIHEAAKLVHGFGRGLVAGDGLNQDPDQDVL